jgi:DMSO/TMAO reductase YedYZ molybdopterin-dependent catalytic subunit
MTTRLMSRRLFLRAGAGSAAALTLTGCEQLDVLSGSDNSVRRVMAGMNSLTYRVHRALIAPDALAPEFSESHIRQQQRPNGSTNPDTEDYLALKERGFADYRLHVSGLVDKPLKLSLDDLRDMAQRTQITRHDCVEGWSTIAKWQGVPLRAVLDEAGIQPSARYVLFRCYDALSHSLSGPELYYETIDLVDAMHPQTILAHAMNGKPLPIENGAPLRVRVERQLGYKMAKYIRSIELVAGFETVFGGQGGYWEDRGYDWYAGI